MFCKNCGAKIDEDSKFCISCGCELAKTVENINVNSEPVLNENSYEEIIETSENNDENASFNNSSDFQTEKPSDMVAKKIESVLEEQTIDENIEQTNLSEEFDGTEINSNKISEYSSNVVENYDNDYSSTKNQKKKEMTIVGGIFAAIFALILIIAISSSGSAERKMNKALDTQNAYEVNVLYSQAYGNSKKLEKYDETISKFLDKVINKLNNVEYSDEDLAENGYTVVYRDLESDWGNLIYSEDSDTIEPSISYYNQTKWDLIKNIIKSRAAYCGGVAYRDSYKQPKEAIDLFKLVTSDDSYYYKVDYEIAKCVDLYVEQTLAEAKGLIDNDDISGAISKIDSINNYLESNGLTSDIVQEKLIETKNKYAETYVKKADECFKEKNVDGAISNIEVAIELVPDNADYQAKKDNYKMYLPLQLYIKRNCLSVEKEGFVNGDLLFDRENKSNNNKEMKNCLLWYNNSSDPSQYIVANYNLEGKYDLVTGTVFLSEEFKDTFYSGYFEMYGDGKLIYTSSTITKNVLPQDLKVSVKGIQNLKIIFHAEGSFGMMGGTYVKFGINNLTATKNFPD